MIFCNARRIKGLRHAPHVNVGSWVKAYTDNVSHADSATMHMQMQATGVVHSDYKERFSAPHQPAPGDIKPARIELNNGMNFNQALADLESFSHIRVIYWMHLNRGWNPTVIPPHGPGIRRGLFATRAPHRPNSIGLTAVRLKKIAGRSLHIEGHDMLDATPCAGYQTLYSICRHSPRSDKRMAARS